MKEKRRKLVIVGLLSVLLLTPLLSLTVYGDVLLRGSHHPGRIIASAEGPTSLDLSDFRPVRMRHGSFFLERDFVPLIQGPRGHVLIQLTQPLNPIMEQELRAQGVELLEYIPENTWKAVVPAAGLAAVKALTSVQAMGSIYPVDKFPVHILERGLAPFSRNEDGTVSVLVSFYSDVPFERVKCILMDLDGITDQSDFISGHRVLLKIPAESLPALAEYDEISWIENRPRPKSSNNAGAAALSNVDDLHAAPYNLDGMGVTMSMWDGGEVQANHPDLTGRVVVVDTGDVSEHATHVAGTMISSGAGNSDAKGMAPAADLYAYDYYGDVPTEMSHAVNSYGAILANHSWGYNNGWEYNIYGDGYWVWFGDENFGNYTSTSQAWDQTVVDTGMIVITAAGNDRNDVGDEDQNGHRHFDIPEDPEIYHDYHPSDGPYKCIGQIGSSKNVITVGAVGPYGAMTSLSSYGPADDGRIKPDLVAKGEYLTSTCTAVPYCSKRGTSMSAPVVTGSIALIAQRYAQLMGADPASDMIKALFVGTAFELGEKGPDYSFGWGLIDAKSAVDLVENGSDLIRTDALGNGEIMEYPLTITHWDKVVRVTVAWTDPAGSPAAAEALVNDIDLELIAPDSTIHLPWILDKDNESLPAFKGVNAVDNIEQVHVTFPEAGNWTIRVKGASIQGSQSFALVTYLKDEFQVNNFDTWSEGNPSAAGLTNGGFVVTWDSSNPGYTTVDTYGRVFDAQGYPAGDDFRLNQTTADTQENSAVAALSGGGFAAVWDSDGQDGWNSGVYGRVFDNNGNATTTEFQVNIYTDYDQQAPDVVGLAGGGFVVVWESKVQDGYGLGVFARRFNASGSPLTGEIQVNTTTENDQDRPTVAALQSGGFVISWRSFDQDGSGYGIYGRVFDAMGTPQTSEFPVNTCTVYSQDSCEAAVLSGGEFVIVWRSFAQDGDASGIYGQIFNGSGIKLGGEFQVNTYILNEQAHPTVSALEDGGFIVIWQSYGQDGNYDGIYARKYDSSGNPISAEYQLNIYTVHDQEAPCSTPLTGGHVVAAWESILQGGSGRDILARVLKMVDDCPCDLNSDGSCNILDWPYFIEDWGRTDCNEPGVVCECDLNGDGSCNILDWPYFIEDWGRTDCP